MYIVHRFWPQSHGDYVPILACCQPWISMNRFLSLTYTLTNFCHVAFGFLYHTPHFLTESFCWYRCCCCGGCYYCTVFTCADCSSFCDLRMWEEQYKVYHETKVVYAQPNSRIKSVCWILNWWRIGNLNGWNDCKANHNTHHTYTYVVSMWSHVH